MDEDRSENADDGGWSELFERARVADGGIDRSAIEAALETHRGESDGRE